MPREGYYLPDKQLVDQANAAIIEPPRLPRSKFTGKSTIKTAFDQGKLIPLPPIEVLPGDHLSFNMTGYFRLSTPLFPLFDDLRIDTHWFFVPNRLVWPNWVKLQGEQDSPSDSIAYTVPQILSPAGGFAIASLFDYMGIPTVGQLDGAGIVTISALPPRMYNLIYNTWYRDENSIGPVPRNTGDAADLYTDYVIQRRAKTKDYFTSALPWPNKFTAPTIPLSGNAPITGIGLPSLGATLAGPIAAFETASDDTYDHFLNTDSAGIGVHIKMDRTAVAGVPPQGRPLIFADLASATGVTINALRQSFLIQQLLERDARGGTRYIEILKSHFGVTSPDFRLQRPEYIGGGSTPMQITPIAQTAPTTGVPLGALGAAGTAFGQHTASYAATEHGYILPILSVKSEISYQQGIHKHWHRLTRYDFYMPALAGLGEQAILRKELFARGIAADDTVFGYQERWHEYREVQNTVSGIMRSTAAATIDMWHLAQEFTPDPTLNQAFIEDNAPMARVLAAGSAAENQQILANIMIHHTYVRPVPAHGTPVLLGRF